MLRLLQNKLSSKSLFFREIIVFVTLLHLFLIVLFCLLGFQKNKSEKFTIRSQSQLSSTIVFLPLKKYVDPSMNIGNKKSSLSKHQSRKIIDYQSYLKKQGYNVVSKTKSNSSSKTVAERKKPVVKKAKKSVAKKKSMSKKAVVKPVKKKSAKKTPAKKKIVAKKKVQKKKPLSKKLVAKKTATKKIEAEKSKSVKKKVATVKESTKSIATADKKVEVAALPQVPSKNKVVDGIDVSDVTFVGYRELDKLQLQSKIQLAVEAYWSPPAGMPSQTVCELQVTIENKGKVVEAKVAKSSKIMAFDLAARSAIYKTKFPQDVWGRQITVELGI